MAVQNRAQAEAAVAVMPPSVLDGISLGLGRPPIPGTRAFAGRALLLAGRAKDAAPLLQADARACQRFVDPYLNTRAHLWLGDALRETGDMAGACRAYREVIDRWGASKPPSFTADEARKRSDELRCAATIR
jgi:hypothetical protein